MTSNTTRSNTDKKYDKINKLTEIEMILGIVLTIISSVIAYLTNNQLIRILSIASVLIMVYLMYTMRNAVVLASELKN